MFSIGPVPVVFVPETGIDLLVTGELDAGLTYGATAEFGVSTYAVRYSDGKWETAFDPIADFEASPPTGHVAGNITVETMPRVQLSAYGATGPYLKFGPFLEYDMPLYPPEPWTLTAGVKGSLGVELDVWLVDLSYELAKRTLLSFQIAEGEDPPPPDDLAITTTSLPNGTVGETYERSLAAEGGFEPHTWSIDAGSLPPGLALAADGSITGVPIAAGTFVFSARVQDQAGTPSSKELNITIDPVAFDDTRLPLDVTYRTVNTADIAWSMAMSLNNGHPYPLVDESQRALIVDEPTVKLLDSTGSTLWTHDLGSLWSTDTSLDLAGFLSGGSVVLVLDDNPSSYTNDLHVAVIGVDGSIVSDTEVVPGASSDGAPKAPLLISSDGMSILFATSYSFGPYDMYVVDLVDGSVVERRLSSSSSKDLKSIEWRDQEVAYTTLTYAQAASLQVLDIASWTSVGSAGFVQGSQSNSFGDWSNDGRLFAWGFGEELPSGPRVHRRGT